MFASTFAQATWYKSSYSSSQANCVEVAQAAWHKSSHSSSEANCVEISATPGLIGVRDTKDRDGGTLAVTSSAWAAFLQRQR